MNVKISMLRCADSYRLRRFPAVLAAVLAIVLGASAAQAQIVVNSTGDGSNGYPPGFGSCDTNAFDNVIVCTLRAAIEVANGNPNVSTITFKIPTTDPGYDSQTHSWTIKVSSSALPDLSTAMNINGPGEKALTIQSTHLYRIFNITTTGLVNISALTIADGHLASGEVGGGVRNAAGGSVTIANCTLRNNISENGGAVANIDPSGSLTLNNSTLIYNESEIGGAISNSGELHVNGGTIRRNAARQAGAGVYNVGNATLTNAAVADNLLHCRFPGPSPANGGGIYSYGSLILISSTISGNSARGYSNGDDYAGEARGGGIFSHGSLSVVNSTISSNSAEGGSFYGVGGAFGGGIAYVGGGTLNLSNSTIALNSAIGGYGSNVGPNEAFAGGIFIIPNGQPAPVANVKSTIIALNSADTSPDVYGPFHSQGFNLIGKKDGSTGFGSATDLKGTIKVPLNPKLGLLQNNGGATQTMALLPGSPAIDKGTSVTIAGTTLTTDQRGSGFPRTHDNGAIANAAGGNGTDIGAFELQTP